MKREGYTNRQIAEMVSVSEKTVARALIINTEKLCVDGSSTRKKHVFLDQYKAEIQELVERGIKSAQVLKKLKAKYPDQVFKRSTVNRYCRQLRSELYDLTESPVESKPALSKDSKLYPYKDEIDKMINEQHPISEIYETIINMGYAGSYSLLQQHCHPLKPIIKKTKKTTRSISRKSVSKMLWARTSIPKEGASTSEDDKNESRDIDFIIHNFPEYGKLETIVKEFRVSYANRDVEAIECWVNTYAECKFQGIKSFINGIKKDSTAFYNSLKYEFNNGLLEGFVNKLKEVKRSMFGRASYSLLRAKMLLLNKSAVSE